jgi:cyclophilin family peptidyl-prolyl cis-trans isomerase/protein-disulfide isomerase
VKKIIPLLLVVVIAGLLSACIPDPQPKVTDPPAPTIQIPTTVALEAATEPSCVPNPPPPTPSEQDLAVFTPDPENDWIKGPEDALITFIEYADFQCPYCSVASENLRALLEKYPDDVRIVYRHFPLASIHDKAIPAAQAAEAAGLQGEEAFWDMHDLLYETQAEWSAYSVEEFDSWVVDAAAEMGLDPAQFAADYVSEAIVNLAEAAWIDGQALGLDGTPYIKVNSLYNARADARTLTIYVELLKLEQQQFAECPPMTVDTDASYRAVVETENGNFVIELFPDIAPMAVNSFIYLAENGWFDGITFHRVIEGFVAQTGDPTGTGLGSPGYRFSNEASSELVFDREGLVAMANSGVDSNGSQFFITYAEAPDLNGGYTIFGEIVEGMDVVRNLTPRNPDSGENLPPGDVLISITIEKQ